MPASMKPVSARPARPPQKPTVLRARLRFVLEPDIALGPGKADMLEQIRATGSISAAGRLMGMSYKRACMMVESMNRCFRRPLVSSTFGGVGAFFNSRFGYEVGYRPAVAENAIYRGTWSNPNSEDMVARMREVFRDGSHARQLGQAAAARAVQFRWEDTTRKLVISLIQSGFIRSGQ